MTKLVDITGQRFGMLTAVKVSKRDGGSVHWLCMCDCGGQSEPRANSLRSGLSRSCGCNIGHNKHGLSYSVEYSIWRGMRARCRDKNGPSYSRYGGRGIKVCPRWDVFENFLSDMGHRPDASLSIDRINNDGDYEPGNCRWATMQEQSNNTSANRFIALDGQRRTVREWERHLGFKVGQISRRLKKGWSEEEAIKTPINAADTIRKREQLNKEQE